MAELHDEEAQLRSVALQNLQSTLQARQRAEQGLVDAKRALEEELQILELLNKTGAMLASNLDLKSLVQAVTDAGTRLSGAQFGAFFYTSRNPQGGSMTLFTLSGAPREAFEKFGHPRATPLFGPTFRGEGIIRIEDVLADPRFGQMAPHHGMPPGHLPVRSYMAAPVVTRSGEVIGGLFFGHADCGVFTARSERLIAGIATHAAVAVDNARLYEGAQKAADERAKLLEIERTARAEIERVAVIKDEFLATLSHELRTPLSAVLGWAQVLLQRAEKDSETRKGLESIVRNANSQARLIDDLLDMNRIVSGRMRIDVQRTDLPAVVQAALESVVPSAEAKGIKVLKTLDPAAGPVFGDPNRLQQVIWNLLANAIKFTPKGGRVRVEVGATSEDTIVRVTDSGEGIVPSFLPHIFEPFRQADDSTTRRHSGLGLGLAIVKQLVNAHGGTIRALSEGIGHGATFEVTLPFKPTSRA